MRKGSWLPFVLAILLGVIVGVVIGTCYLVVGSYQKYMYSLQTVEPTHVGIVLGAGIKDGKPYDELKAHRQFTKRLVVFSDKTV